MTETPEVPSVIAHAEVAAAAASGGNIGEEKEPDDGLDEQHTD